jgi:hypothetical protein
MLAIHDFDALEIHPVRNVNWTGQPLDLWPNLYATWCQPWEPHEAHFWSVYGRLKNGCIECFEDFPDEARPLPSPSSSAQPGRTFAAAADAAAPPA